MKIVVIGQAEINGESDNRQHSYDKTSRKRFIMVEHNNKKLQWNIPARTWNAEPDTNSEAFDQINMYFALLSEPEQAGIFAEYEKIHSILRSINIYHDECENLIEAIRPHAKIMFSYISEKHFNDWVWSSLKPIIPASASAVTFDPNTMPGTRERTYLRPDYLGLIPLAIIYRMASPIWFDFLALTKGQLNREHKDMLTFSLVEQAWPAKCDAMKRLEEFVDHTVGNDRNNPAATLAGIGTDDFVYWALSSLVIHRLPVVDVMGWNNATPVVSALYNFVRHRVTTIGSSQPAIKNKFAETSYAADENNQSYLEGFRNRIALTIGQESYGDYYLERQIAMGSAKNPDQLADFGPFEQEFSLINRVAPGIDLNLIIDALDSVKVLENVPLSDEQVTIAAWLFHPYSQVRAVGNLFKERVIVMLAIAQAVLLHLDMKDLAILVTAGYHRVDNTGGVHFIGETISILRPNDRLLYQTTFPLEQRSRNGKNVKNFVYNDVYQLVKNLQDYEINCTFTAATLAKIQNNNPNRNYSLSRNAVTMFMEYVKYLAERPIVKIDPDEIYRRLTMQQVSNGDGIETIGNF
jgi:hypothetical protein